MEIYVLYKVHPSTIKYHLIPSVCYRFSHFSQIVPAPNQLGDGQPTVHQLCPRLKLPMHQLLAHQELRWQRPGKGIKKKYYQDQKKDIPTRIKKNIPRPSILFRARSTSRAGIQSTSTGRTRSKSWRRTRTRRRSLSGSRHKKSSRDRSGSRSSPIAAEIVAAY